MQCQHIHTHTHAQLNSLVEQHGQHHLVGLLWQVGQEQDVVGRVVWNLEQKADPDETKVS